MTLFIGVSCLLEQDGAQWLICKLRGGTVVDSSVERGHSG